MKKNQTKFTIKDWSLSDRPREKMAIKGKDVLTDAELIAILIGSGNRRETAVDLSKKILASCEYSLHNLAQLSIRQLTNFNGIGQAKAISIITGLELGRRFQSEKLVDSDKIRSSRDVFELMRPLLGDLPHEEFWVLYLNNSNKVLYKWKLSKGGLTGTIVDIRLLLKKAIEFLATAVILCHNHPSGNILPSQADKNMTHKLKLATKTLDIKVIDHLIITEKAYFSFADENLL